MSADTETAVAIGVLKTEMNNLKKNNEDKWAEHNGRSSRNWNEVKTTMSGMIKGMNDLKTKIGELPCKVHDERFKGIRWHIRIIWGGVSTIAIGIIMTAWQILSGGR